MTNPSADKLTARRAQVEKELAALRAELRAKTEAKATVSVKVAQKPPEPTTSPMALADPTRPQSLDEVIGQESLIQQLRIVIHGARLRGTPMPHVLLTGPPGYGKSSLASIIAHEMESALVVTSGPVLKKPENLSSILIQATGPTCLFIDEVHSASKACLETLYTAMEDGVLDVMNGSGADASAYRHKLPPLVVIGATTSSGGLAQPFKDRFGAQFAMDDYTTDEIAKIAAKVWDRRGVRYAKSEPLALSARSRGVPRKAVTYAERVLDVVTVKGGETIKAGDVAEALALFGVDANGLDDNDRKILSALCGPFAGRSVGLSPLAQLVDIDEKTIQENHEGYLVRRGLIIRSRTGRVATNAAYSLLKDRETA